MNRSRFEVFFENEFKHLRRGKRMNYYIIRIL